MKTSSCSATATTITRAHPGHAHTSRFGALFLAMLTTWYVGLTHAQTTAQVAQNTLPTLTAEVREVDRTYPAEAVVEAVRQATLAAQVTGRIMEARVDVGTRVKAGEVLMRIDTREATEALAGAQAQYTQSRANLTRIKELYAQKFISQAALDKAEADNRTAAANAARAGAASSHAVIVAPFAGIIAQRLAEPGEMANPGRPLISLFEPGGMRVVANIPQYKLADVRQALRGNVEFPGNPDWLEAQRIEVLPTIDPLSHSVRVRLYLPDALSANIVPGLFARAHFVIGTTKKLLVPATAVVRRGELTGLYILDPQGKPRLRQVRLGETVANGQIEILAGISTGEKIILDPLKASFQAAQPR